MLTAGEFCNRDVVIASPGERVVDVARVMRDHHVGSVVIVERQPRGNVPIGVLTDRDIVVGLLAVEPSYLDRAAVRDVLTDGVVVGREDEDLYSVMARMRAHGVRRIPITDGAGVLQGIIAFDDLLEHVVEELQRLTALLAREGDNERKRRPGASPAG